MAALAVGLQDVSLPFADWNDRVDQAPLRLN
jgi:hypothetical protein